VTIGMTWEEHSGNDNFNELHLLGSRLSKEINCAVRYPAHEKHMFECKCGVTFPVFLVKAEDWEGMREIHNNGGRR